MKRFVSRILALVLALSLPVAAATAEELPVSGQYGALGRLTKLNITEDTLNELLKERMAGDVFSGIVFYDSLNSMLLALNNGDIAIIEIDRNTADYIVSRNDNFVVREPYNPANPIVFSMLLREEDGELRDRISAVIREMEADGSLASLKKAFIEDVIAGADPEAVVPKAFDGAKTLRVAVTGDRPPMDYISAGGVPKGYNTALVAEAAARMGMNVEFVSVDTAARGILLAAGGADVIFWREEEEHDIWESARGEDMPAHTIATEYYLKSPVVYVVLSSSPLAEVLKPVE